MSDKTMTYRDLLQIVELVKTSSHFNEFRLKTDELELDIRRGPSQAAIPVAAPAAAPVAAAAAPAPAAVEAPAPAPTAATATPSKNKTAAALPEGAIVITSPMVGTFYRAPEPGAAPYVEVGQQVKESDTVCLIEVMKLINSIPAPHDGTIEQILVEDGEPVEFGQPLIVILPR